MDGSFSFLQSGAVILSAWKGVVAGQFSGYFVAAVVWIFSTGVVAKILGLVIAALLLEGFWIIVS